MRAAAASRASQKAITTVVPRDARSFHVALQGVPSDATDLIGWNQRPPGRYVTRGLLQTPSDGGCLPYIKLIGQWEQDSLGHARYRGGHPLPASGSGALIGCGSINRVRSAARESDLAPFLAESPLHRTLRPRAPPTEQGPRHL